MYEMAKNDQNVFINMPTVKVVTGRGLPLL